MKKVLFILFLFYAFTASGQQKEPIIDVHLHCYDRWGPHPDTAWYPKQVARPATTEALMRQSLKALERKNKLLEGALVWPDY